MRVFNVVLGSGVGQAQRHRCEPEVAEADKPSIAVLPFTNMSGDPGQEYFSDGITEDIITDLRKVSGLFVVGRNTSFTYKGKPIQLQQVAAELGVKFILEGSVRKAGERVRVTGQLIDGATGGHLWADRFDRDLTDIFAIQDEITQTIVEQLKIRLLPQEKKAIAQAPTANVEAYTYYLKGRQFFHNLTKAFLLLARQMFAKAAETRPIICAEPMPGSPIAIRGSMAGTMSPSRPRKSSLPPARRSRSTPICPRRMRRAGMALANSNRGERSGGGVRAGA